MESNIKNLYRKNNSKRILQGDLITEVEIPIIENKQLKFINSDYNFVLSQDCDLNQDFDAHNGILTINFEESNKEISSFYNKMIPSILLCPAYPADKLREGNHLSFLGLEMSSIGKTKSTSWRNIKQNNNPRYHFLNKSESRGLPELVIDFKRYYALSREYIYEIYEKCYYISLNELYREDLSNRFFNFQSRIGLP